MSVAIHICITIAAPPEEVWRAVERIETHTEWMLDAESITFRSEQHSGFGAAFECVTRVGPFHTREEAESMREQLKKLGLDSVVTDK